MDRNNNGERDKRRLVLVHASDTRALKTAYVPYLLSGDDKKKEKKKISKKSHSYIFTLDPLFVDIACVYYDVLCRPHTIYI